MDPTNSCQCCLIRPLDKSLRKCYRRDHEKEVYSDMLEECFDIQLLASQSQVDGGICKPCIMRLRDACDFKRQVQCCQQQLRTIKTMESEIPMETKVKIEQEDDVVVVVVESDPEFVDDNVKQTPEYHEVEVCKPEKSPEPSKATTVHSTIDTSKRLHGAGDTRRKDPPKDNVVNKQAPISPKKSMLKNLLNVPILHAATVQRTQAVRPNVQTNRQGDTKEKKARPRPKVSTPYKNYDKKTFEEALEAVRTKTMSCAKASLHYHVPKSSIAAKLALDRKNSGLDTVRPKPTKSISEKVPKRVYSKTSADTVRTHEANVRTLIQHSNCTPFLTRTIAGIECCYCEAKLLNLTNLREHMQSAHTNDQYHGTKNRSRDLTCKIDITDLKCKLCEQDFDLLSSLKEHLIEEHDVEFFPEAKTYIFEFKLSEDGIQCCYCEENFPSLAVLKEHMQATHTSDQYRLYRNVQYSTGFSRRRNVHCKMDITDLKCKLCEQNFDLVPSLKEHLIKEHAVKFTPEEKSYIIEFKLSDGEVMHCALCSSTFEAFKTLLHHMNKHYRNFICKICDMGYLNEHKLVMHQKTHSTGSFQCSGCPKVFPTLMRRLRHENHIHKNGNRPRKCPFCEKTFGDYGGRNKHILEDHNSMATTYKCNTCDRVFTLKLQLSNHIRQVHLMEKNHKCTICGHAFFLKYALKKHMVTHKGDRIYKCTECNKGYARKNTLREHMRIHENDRRFKCEVCGSAFVQKCSLKGHLLSAHNVIMAELEQAKVVPEA